MGTLLGWDLNSLRLANKIAFSVAVRFLSKIILWSVHGHKGAALLFFSPEDCASVCG